MNCNSRGFLWRIFHFWKFLIHNSSQQRKQRHSTSDCINYQDQEHPGIRGDTWPEDTRVILPPLTEKAQCPGHEVAYLPSLLVPSLPFLTPPSSSLFIISLQYPTLSWFFLPFLSLHLPFPSHHFISLHSPTLPWSSLPFPPFPFVTRIFPTTGELLRQTHHKPKTTA